MIGVGIVSGGGGDSAAPVTSAGTVVPVTTASPTAPVETVTAEDQIVTETTDVAVPKTTIDRTLGDGLAGDDVEMVQQRLADLGFDPGPVDGYFGTLTKQAVWAFEKLVMKTPRSEATGRVTPEMWDRMQDPISIQPRRPTGGLADHVEIYLPEQVMLVFHADRPVLIAHVSTGELRDGATGFVPWYENAAEYRETITIDTDINGDPLPEPEEKAVIGWSYTPPGVFEAYRKIEGIRNGPLGGMWDPIYINQGIAIHGALNVPLEPASHGCIRVSQYLGEYLQSIIELGDRVLIWDGVTEPEQQPAEVQKMRWDQPDPDATTTTTSTTTTTTTTTVPPATTVAPPTTTTPPATTTTSTTTTTTDPPSDEPDRVDDD
ncbi:MAG: peptidoglycan-binding protein [Acidimicrobiia bacterium]